MHTARGFTIVELAVVLVIMAILLTLATFSIGSYRANTRDNERNTDIKVIATGLETRYKEGNSKVTSPSYVAAGSYPDINEMSHMFGNTVSGFTPAQISGGYTNDVLPGTTVQNFSPPGVSGLYGGFQIATCSGACPADVQPTITKDTYYYEPVDANGNVCVATTCIRFNLYWRTEVDNQTHLLRSNHQ